MDKSHIAEQIIDSMNLHNPEYIRHTVEEMKRLRHWFAGFEAAGGTLPACVKSIDCVWKAHVLLEDYYSLIKLLKSTENS